MAWACHGGVSEMMLALGHRTKEILAGADADRQGRDKAETRLNKHRVFYACFLFEG
jgi:hypothetical protein